MKKSFSKALPRVQFEEVFTNSEGTALLHNPQPFTGKVLKKFLQELIKKLKGSKGMRADEIKRDLYDDLEEEIKEGAKSARLVRLMSPSISGGLVETKGRTRSTKYKLTTKGESYLRSFEPLIELYKQKPKFE